MKTTFELERKSPPPPRVPTPQVEPNRNAPPPPVKTPERYSPPPPPVKPTNPPKKT